MVIAEEPQTNDQDGLVLEIQDLEFHYGPNRAVNRFSLSLEKGEILGLIGKNGAGKTTTIHLILGLLRYNKGLIHVLGLDPKKDTIKILSRCGFFPEQGEPYAWMRIRELFKLGQYTYRDWDKELSVRLADQLELDTGKRISALSKGMLVKVKLIFALAHHPQLLLLDEPTNGLDPLSRYDLMNIIKTLAARHEASVLISSHNLEEISDIATRICVIDRGQNMFTGSMEAVKSQFTLLELSPGAVLPENLNRLVIKSKSNGSAARYLISDKTDPALIHFLEQSGPGAILKNLDLKELFVFLARNEDI